MTDQQGVVEGFVGAVEDTEITSCERTGSGWTNTGYITNPTEETQDYRVYVSFMGKGDTLGLIQVDDQELPLGQLNHGALRPT